MKNAPLPPLAFGAATAVIDTDVRIMEEKLQRFANGMQQFDSLSQHGQFQHTSSILNINGMRIGATASTATRVKTNPVGSLMLMIPFHGHGHYEMSHETMAWSADQQAVLLPNQPFTGESSERSSLVLLLDERRLEKTLEAMLGEPLGAIAHFDADRPWVLDLNHGPLSFNTVFRQQAHFLNAFAGSTELLNSTGIDDGIYRSVVMLLNIKLFSHQFEVSDHKSPRGGVLDKVCAYIMHNLNEVITLTALEEVSSMSIRKLQYSFLSQFNCTPMQWVRTRRLENAQNFLLSAPPDTRISQIANLCGFRNMSTFSNRYKLHFGELPSKTLRRSQG
ncbi:MAG: AraC-like DNA-binding protein [Polaromonas sp.]|jgi:AraC-like DNA-binding protein